MRPYEGYQLTQGMSKNAQPKSNATLKESAVRTAGWLRPASC